MADKDKGEKFEKNGDKDISGGPIPKRGCTDLLCCILFIVHIVGFWVVTMAGLADGNPWKLIAPRDYKGGFCGVDPAGLEDYGKLLMSMNTTSTFDLVAEEMLCGPTGYQVLVSVNQQTNPFYDLRGILTLMSEAEYNTACGINGSTLELDPMQLAADMEAYTSAQVDKYTDPAKAGEMFSGSKGSEIFSEATKYFNMICTKDCGLKSQGFANPRTWTYTPDADVKWKVAWDTFTSNLKIAENISSFATVLDPFKFLAWPESDCPYPAKYCIPMPATDFVEVGSSGLCMPSVNSGLVGGVLNTAASTALDGIARSDVQENAEQGVGKLMGDILNSLDVLILTGVFSIVIGLLLLVLLRFFLAPAVWIVLISIFVLLAGGGLAIFTKASQCADQSFSDAASSQKDAAVNSSDGSVTNPFGTECVGGYAVESETLRDAMTMCSYVVLGLAVLYLFFTICLSCRIRLAIKINQVAAQFVYNNPMIILLPLIQGFLMLVWAIIWIFCACFLISQVPPDEVPSGAFTYDEAYGNDGQCNTDQWPAGGVYKNGLAPECAVNATNPACWSCYAPRFFLGPRFAYSFFSYLWQNGFVLAACQCIIAGAVGVWFFTPREEKGSKPAIMISTKNALFWHPGSLAFGSFILAVVQFLRWFMAYLQKQAEAQKNAIMSMICKILGCCLWCFEKCVKFLNKNAYIQVALMGTNFCKSAKNAFFLILRNALRFAVICGLSFFVHFVGILFITVATAFLGYMLLDAMHPDIDKIFPTILYACIGYVIGKLFMSVFGMAVDATLQCFIATEELGAEGDFVPGPLRSLVDENPKEGKDCCAYICPCCCGGDTNPKASS